MNLTYTGARGSSTVFDKPSVYGNAKLVKKEPNGKTDPGAQYGLFVKLWPQISLLPVRWIRRFQPEQQTPVEDPAPKLVPGKYYVKETKTAAHGYKLNMRYQKSPTVTGGKTTQPVNGGYLTGSSGDSIHQKKDGNTGDPQRSTDCLQPLE